MISNAHSGWFSRFTTYLTDEFSLNPVRIPLQPSQNDLSERTKEKIRQAVSVSANSASEPSLKQQFKPSSALSGHDNQQVKEVLTNNGLLNLGPQLEENIKEYDRLWTEQNKRADKLISETFKKSKNTESLFKPEV